MTNQLFHDNQTIADILHDVETMAIDFLAGLAQRSPAIKPDAPALTQLPATGLGAKQAIEIFMQRYGAGISGSAGPRFFGFVTGGTTPAALAADWLTSTFDQNATGFGDSVAPLVEIETLAFLRDLFDLPADFSGSFVTGATMSNFVNLALARQWVARERGIDVAADGLYGLADMPILAATPHSSSYKSLSMLGMGRNNLELVPCLAGREAMDVAALENRLAASGTAPTIVIASAGTVNTVDFDDFKAIAALKQKHRFWLHIDGAFGAFAAVSPQFKHLMAGAQHADSITIDAHKWLNVPYDSAMQFTRHADLQIEVFQNAAVYLGNPSADPNFVHRTPENSRRFRALAAWMTLIAYGKDGYREIIERNCALARDLGARIDGSPKFKLLAPVSLNGICFTLADAPSMAEIDAYLMRLRDNGRIFLTPTQYKDTPAIRVSISNWRTQTEDIDIAWQALQETLTP